MDTPRIDASRDDKQPSNGSVFKWFSGRTKMQYAIAASLVVVVSGLTLVWLLLPGLISGPRPGNFDQFHLLIELAQERNADNFELWYKINIIMQCVLIMTAILATILAAVTTPENSARIRKWTILVTAITAALASAQSVFHIKENLEVFIRAVDDLNRIEYAYLVERAPYEEAMRKDPARVPPRELLQIQQKYADQISRVTISRMRAWASIGQQGASPSRPDSRDQNSSSQNTQNNSVQSAVDPPSRN
jgi:hypothetical protein